MKAQSSISEGSKVLALCTVVQVLPSGVEVEPVDCTLSTESLITVSTLREVLSRARSKAPHALRSDMGQITWNAAHPLPRTYCRQGCSGCAWEDEIDALLSRLPGDE